MHIPKCLSTSGEIQSIEIAAICLDVVVDIIADACPSRKTEIKLADFKAIGKTNGIICSRFFISVFVLVVNDAIAIAVDKLILEEVAIFIIHLLEYIECARRITDRVNLNITTNTTCDSSGGYALISRIIEYGQSGNLIVIVCHIHSEIPGNYAGANRCGKQ